MIFFLNNYLHINPITYSFQQYISMSEDRQNVYDELLLLLKDNEQKEIVFSIDELLQYIIYEQNIKISVIAECITINDFLRKSYDNEQIFKYVIDKYNLEYIYVKQCVDNILKNKEIMSKKCYHELTYNKDYN